MLYILPHKRFAAAFLTNSEGGRHLINDLVSGWFEELIGSRSPYGAEAGPPPLAPRIVADRYVGTYENILSRYEVSKSGDGLGMAMCFKFRLYDSSKTQIAPVVPLRALGGDDFLLEPTDAQAGTLLSTAKAIRLSFKTPDENGVMQHLSLPAARPEGRLYRRVPQHGVLSA
jgi:hypothetical protein